jgi:hypothetical protein
MIITDPVIRSHYDPASRVSIELLEGWAPVRSRDFAVLYVDNRGGGVPPRLGINRVATPAEPEAYRRVLATMLAADREPLIDRHEEDLVIDGARARLHRSSYFSAEVEAIVWQCHVTAQVRDAVFVVTVLAAGDAAERVLEGARRAIASMRFIPTERTPALAQACHHAPGLHMSIAAPGGWTIGGDDDWPLVITEAPAGEPAVSGLPRLRAARRPLSPATPESLGALVKKSYGEVLPARLTRFAIAERYAFALDGKPAVAVHYGFDVDGERHTQLDVHWLVDDQTYLLETSCLARDEVRCVPLFEQILASARHIPARA